MVPMTREQEPRIYSNHSSPTREAASPLVVDNIEVDNDMDEDEKEIENENEDVDEDEDEDYKSLRQELEHFRERRAARTLYHERRSEADTLNSTQSLFDTDIEYHTLGDRRYCEHYNFPNDDAEQGRMQLLHSVFFDILDGRLTLAPLQRPKRILDIGAGTGDWAIAMAESYSSTKVTGTDIAKIQPTSVPDNVEFEIDDAEYEGGWTWPKDTFDLVHIRNMIGAFRDWNQIYREAFRTTKPGGYVDVMDPDIASLSKHFRDNPRVREFFNALSKAANMAGRPMGIAHLETQFLAAAGFTDIHVTTKTMPCGGWPSDDEERKTGQHFLAVVYHGIEAASLRLFVEELKWKPEDVSALCRDVSRAIKALANDPCKSTGFGMDVRVLVGRKPGCSELELPDDKSAMGDSMQTVRNGDFSGGGDSAIAQD